MTIALSLPYHVYGYVDKSFVSDGTETGWEPAVWFGITLPLNRAIGLTVLLENGAQYRELPSHAWTTHSDLSAPLWPLQDAQRWDCFGGEAQVLEYAYLRDLPVAVREFSEGQTLTGWYLFTLEMGENGYSRYPPQSKSFHAIELATGRLTWQSNDYCRWHEASFTDAEKPTDWIRRQRHVWGVEDHE